jgi:hypothetical protein
MAGRFLEKVFHPMRGGPPRLSLERRKGALVLLARRGNEPILFSELARQGRLPEPFQWPDTTSPEVRVPLEKLAALREALAAVEGVEVRIAPDVPQQRLEKPPRDFRWEYGWTPNRASLLRQLPSDIAYFGQGWFASWEQYWRLDGFQPGDELWLVRDTVEGEDLLPFLTEALPDWQKRGWPVVAQARFDPAPALSLQVVEVQADLLELSLRWQVAPGTLAELPGLAGYVNASGVVRPGISAERAGLPPHDGTLRLKGEEIPRFLLQARLAGQPWAEGNLDDISRLHPLWLETGELTLEFERVEEGGVGRVEAIPYYRSGVLRISAEVLSHAMNPKSEFLRVEGGWLPLASLIRAKVGSMGMTTNGIPLKPRVLGPDEVFRGGSTRLEGPWKIDRFPSVHPPDDPSIHRTAELHLEFLRHWGIPGGLVGNLMEFAPVLGDWLAQFLGRYPEVGVLMVGMRRTLQALASSWGNLVTALIDEPPKEPLLDRSRRGLVLVTPKTLEATFDLTTLDWSILLLLEADTLIKSASSRLFRGLLGNPRKLTLGTFASLEFLRNPQTRQAMSQIFDVPTFSAVWQQGVRNPGVQPLPTLRRYEWGAARASTFAVRPAEISLGSGPDTGAMPIPIRQDLQPGASLRAPGVEHQAMASRDFLTEAQSWQDRPVQKAPFVPFTPDFPLHADLSESQGRWFLYWRSLLQAGESCQTSLSYILLRAYEIINRIGEVSIQDGVCQLHSLWRSYRKTWLQLDMTLLHWSVDFAVLHQQPDPLASYREAADEFIVPFPDLILPHYARDLSSLPLGLLEGLSGLRLRESRFYQQGGAEAMARFLPGAVAAMDRFFLAQDGKDLLARFQPDATRNFQRYPFGGARYLGESCRICLGEARPYSHSSPFRSFLSAVLRHAENRLRELRKFPERLSGGSLEPRVRQELDQFLRSISDRVIPRPRVEIDLGKIQELVAESDQVREMLKIEEFEPLEEPEPTEEAAVESVSMEGLSEDWASFGRALTPVQSATLAAILAGGRVEEELARIAKTNSLMPQVLLDSINELALDTLGDILILSDGDQPRFDPASRSEVCRLLAMI